MIERSIAAYRPDAAMRRQIVAADVYSRAPGSRAPAVACEIDHEQPFGSGGPTRESNLALKDVRSHQFKTEGWWSSALAPRRDLTWETILGQIEQTRGHDYRQYLPSARTTGVTTTVTTSDPRDGTHPDAAVTDPAAPSALDAVDEPGRPTPEDDLDLACRALYSALAHRGVGALLADPDDADGATDHDPRLTGWITLTHRGQDGQRRGGAPEDLATVASLLGFSSPTVADASDASDASADRRDMKRGHDTAESTPPWREPRDEPPPF
ncbi:HNH endonuclease signature motif containing protein [Serinicoccus profundi]|uniref:HNH endonuclease signature motif containing protein n=1 Tax=Serinicoccus profundi TaxID=1078471 RepID=UPI000255E569|nr:HNH endonuclease signature motif containing protein [Serinicoccus profundi]